MPVDEAQQDLEDQQPHLRVLVQGEGEQRLQEGAGQRRQHVGGLEACRHLERTSRRSKAKKDRNVSITHSFLVFVCFVFCYLLLLAITCSKQR